MELQDYRRQYTKGGLREASMPDDPMVLFEQWQRDASVAGLADPTGVVVATVQPDGSIRQRFVLLKGVSEDGFVFFTNYNSDKAAALAQNDRSSMLFPWNELDRQVSVSGKVEKIAESESDAYFAARPRASQIAAWTSQQSQPIASRGALEAQYQATLERFDGGDVPRPGHWGGFKLVPERIEFWQGGEDRLHDRFVYHYANGWSRLRLQP
ncbi:MAG: pyridoxamine 5'-phosphate oxidase [Halieaceae bacterium]|mgnify:FL=1|nr:pyridoxamine 5'-phosphate oxidase [Halieaceae bacterium]MEC7009230.1 pyridoxamine 5'-phosphate oxidase [Pseudomonadota bacterium]MAP04169.1 pyridoxamine 5'-phosphate oxidase [Halieaceae bacterium]MEC7150151.1 pyridoxamine 5'-phosphate oxidase [Pseudomonadota bacterium]MEC7959844.1 pyridoxamine 5'-phosphate oxidase [Pseudomonadota bacterium]|tara:strand:+ start:839 stop:1471 length:633 start_codon:yes stop_codon:yes gene_type:complete